MYGLFITEWGIERGFSSACAFVLCHIINLILIYFPNLIPDFMAILFYCTFKGQFKSVTAGKDILPDNYSTMLYESEKGKLALCWQFWHFPVVFRLARACKAMLTSVSPGWFGFLPPKASNLSRVLHLCGKRGCLVNATEWNWCYEQGSIQAQWSQ